LVLEIRPYREEEAQAFFRVPSIVFGNYTGEPQRPGEGLNIPPPWSLCAFEDGELATTYAAFPLVARLNGGKAPMAGVTMVGTLPWFRRRGHLRKIMETDFKRRYEQRMEPIAGLLASIAAIYQRYGYGVCSTSVRYSIDPKLIGFVPSLPPARGRWREGTKDEQPLLEQLYRAFTKPRNGALHRAPAIWEGQVLGLRSDFGPPGFGPSLISIYEEGDVPQGYVAYAAKFLESSSSDSGGPGQRLFVRDFACLTPGAYRAMWEQFRTFDLVTRVWVNAAPIDDPAPHILLDPRELNATHRDHLLARILDIERALPLRPYGREGRVIFEVRDEMCRWNDGRWILDAGAEGATVTRAKESPQLTLDVSTLAQLLFGQVSPSRAVRYGRAEAAPNAPLELWDAMWKTEYAPFLPDIF
jgi:predicted acetyltransferase